MKILPKIKDSKFPISAITYFFLLIFMLAKVISAEAQDKYDRIMLKHPFYQNHNWKNSSDSTIFNVNSTFKNHSPENVVVHGNDTIAWFAYNSNNKVYLFKATVTYPSNPMQTISIATSEPIELIGIPTNTINTILVPNFTYPDSVIYASSNNSSIRLLFVNGNSGSIVFDTTSSFGNSERILSLFSTNENSSLSPKGSSIWIGGENGSLLRILVSNIPTISSEFFNISGNESITAISQDICGTASGKLFELQSNSFTPVFSGTSSAIKNLSQNSAINESGSILLKIGNNWNSFSNSLSNINGIHKIHKKDGSGIELLDNNWNYSTITLCDSATILDFNNSLFNSNWNQSGSLELKDTTSIKITLSDLDKNYTIPDFSFNGNGSLFKNDSIYISNSVPDRNYNADTSDLADSIISIIFKDNYIKISLTTRKRTYNPMTYKNNWFISEETFTYDWDKSDVFDIKLNGNELAIINIIGQTITMEPSISNSSNTAIRIYSKNNNFILPKNINEEYKLALYSLNGRTLFKQTISPKTQFIKLDNLIGNQMLIAVMFFKNGKIVKQPVNIMK